MTNMKLEFEGGGVIVAESESIEENITVTLPSAPGPGQVFYNSMDDCVMMYDGNDWIEVADAEFLQNIQSGDKNIAIGTGSFQKALEENPPHALDRLCPSNYGSRKDCLMSDKELEEKYPGLKEMRKAYREQIKQNARLTEMRKEYDELQEKYIVFETLARDHTEN